MKPPEVTAAGATLPAPEPPGLALLDIDKRFGSTHALRGATLRAHPGEVHGVLGENGAGKSTLMAVAAGVIPPDQGRIVLDGVAVSLSSPREAGRAGIGLVHQHFTQVPRLTVAENLALGWVGSATPLQGGTGRRRLPFWSPPVPASLRAEALRLMDRTGLRLPLEAPVEELGVGLRQRVEILKVLLRRPRVLILDEPTAVLAPQEVEGVLALLRELAEGGATVLLIAHKLNEVLSVADRVTVLRDGRTVLQGLREAVGPELLTRAMVGETPAPLPSLIPVPALRREVARLEGASVRDRHGGKVLADVTLAVSAGEVVGVAGVEGNGQEALALLLSGRAPPFEGRAHLPSDPALIPGDRNRDGLALRTTLTENVALALHRDRAFRRHGLVRWSAIRDATVGILDRFQVRAPGPEARGSELSGGNQQKVVVGRELVRDTPLLVAHNPTRGLDVAAARAVRAAILKAAGEEGRGVVLISTDLDEVLALSHRVLVLVRGTLTPVPEGDRSRMGVGSRMLSAG